MNYCPFCREELAYAGNINKIIEYCDNHESILLLQIEPSSFFLCKEQYEIYVGTDVTTLSVHKQYELKELQYNPNYIEYPKINRNGYLYAENGTTILCLKQRLPITPDNFDYYVKRLKSLVIFS